jgi:hypothetical protein
MFKVTVTTELTDERIKDVLTGAFEGGSNYWYEILTYVNPNKVEVQYKHLDLPFVEGCGVLITDREDEDFKPVLLNREAIEKGLDIMGEKYDWHLKAILEENDDAGTSDVLLQCALFGEIVFG